MSEIVAIEPKDLERDNIIRVEWMISKRCNFNCSYCTEFVHDNYSNFPSLEVMKSTIDKLLLATEKDIHLAITGGEPVLCKHLIDFCQYAKSYSRIKDIAITTNGSRSFKYYKQLIEYVDGITFSYHFEYAKKERVPETIKQLAVEYSKKINVHMMMLPTAFDEAIPLINDLRELNINVVIRRIRPAFDKYDLEKGIVRWTKPYEDTTPTFVFTDDGKVDWKNDKGYYSDKEEEYLAQVPVSFKKDTVVYTDNLRKIVNKNEILMNKENFFEGWTCWSGIMSLKIQPDGEVYNAACRVKNLGNIYTDFNVDKLPIICNKQACICAADIPITKIKDIKYKNKVRLNDD